MFNRTNRFELTDLNTGRARVRNHLFERRGTAVANVISTGHEVSVEEDDRLTYLFVTQGQAEIEIGDKVIRARPGQGVLLGTGCRTTKVRNYRSANYAATALLVSKRALEDLDACSGAPALSKTTGKINGELAPVSDAFRRLNSYLVYAGSDLLRDASFTPSRRLAQSAEQFLLDLFSEAIGDIPQLGQAGATSTDLKKVRQAEEYMRASLDESIQLADVCQAVGVSGRSLQIAFQKNRGMSPTATLQRIRLEEIHRRLLNNTSNKSITEIAHECGWTHLGRLSAAFKKRFGQSPSFIRRKARST